MDLIEEVKVATSTLDEHKAEDIKVIDVSSHSPFVSYYVLATCSNIRALGAMADILEEAFDNAGFQVSTKEGEPESGWMIVEAGEVLVHIFLDVNRREINLEQLMDEINAKHRKLA
ncbi:MAG: ribosome silencing factor [Bacilli bacterium]|nr:ribosome silencing factor [Bacilli bacterium]